MKTKHFFLIAILLLTLAHCTIAQENDLGLTLGAKIASKYIWRGFDIYEDDASVFQPSITLDLYGTGFGLKVLSSRANTGEYENDEELDFTLFYSNGIYEGESFATDYRVGWVYYSFPDEPRKAKNMQEIFAEFSWPQICPAGIVPRYTILCMWPSESDSRVSSYGGWAHIFGLDYGLAIAQDAPILNLSAEVMYNDGLAHGAASSGASVDHDWSHALFGASMDFDITENLTETLGVYYQVSMDDSVNNEDETWISVSLKYKF